MPTISVPFLQAEILAIDGNAARSTESPLSDGGLWSLDMMKEVAWRLWHDMRVSKGVESRDLYGVALEQARWCDERGLTDILTSEHHGNDEVASPFAFLAALGAVTNARA